jgi:hypothetical protein
MDDGDVSNGNDGRPLSSVVEALQHARKAIGFQRINKMAYVRKHARSSVRRNTRSIAAIASSPWMFLALLLLGCCWLHRTSALRRPPLVAASLPNRRTRLIADTEDTKSSAAWLDGLKNGLASAAAAGCVKTCLQPIDAIKTIQQYHQVSSGSSLTLLDACREILQRPGGFVNFYAGLGVTVFGAMPGVALYFGVYSYCKRVLLQTDFGQSHKTLSIAMSAAIGNSVASFSRVPYEVVKQQLQTQAYDTTWQAFKAIAASDNWLGMIFPKGGVAVQMIRDVPYAVVTLLLYESLQSTLSRSLQQSTSQQKAWDFALGGVAGGIGSWVTNPMDVVKTRLQTRSELYGGSVAQCVSSIWREGGAAAFLRGSVPRLMHKVPANAFFFLFYEFFRRVLRVEDAVADFQSSHLQPRLKNK